MNDQAQKLRELAENREQFAAFQGGRTKGNTEGKSIAVTSGKGGVGKSNIALFLSVFLASFKKKVLLLDADLGLANVHILLGIAPEKNISHFIDGKCSIEQIVYHGPGGIDIVPGASGLEKIANLDHGRLEMFQHEFVRLESQYDYVIVDTGAGIGTTVTQFASKTDITLLVMTPEPTSLADAYAMVKVLYEKGCEKIGVVVNMCISDREANETFDRLNTLVVKFLKRPVDFFGSLPVNRDIPQYVKKQKLIVLDKGHEQFNNKVINIVRRISGIQVVRKESFFLKFWNRTQKKLIE